MGPPSVREAREIKRVLDDFMAASGMFNQDKSHIFFFNTLISIQFNIFRILGFRESSLSSKYLGVLLLENVVRNVSWEDLLAKMEMKLSFWTFQTLNIVGKLFPLRSVLQAIPLYIFLALVAPKHILKTIQNIQRNFL
jgi:hypothetical protein